MLRGQSSGLMGHHGCGQGKHGAGEARAKKDCTTLSRPFIANCKPFFTQCEDDAGAHNQAQISPKPMLRIKILNIRSAASWKTESHCTLYS